MKKQLILLSLGTVALASAQTVTPNSRANFEGNSSFALFVEGSSTRTYQMIIGASELTGLIGKNINGLSWRLDANANSAWPAVGGTMSNFDIRLGASVKPTQISGTYANNFTGPVSLVRTGALTMDPGAFSKGGSPNAWGPNISFNTPYLYTGGNLAVEYRFTGMPMGSGQPVLDASFQGEEGFMTNYASAWSFGDFETSALFFGVGSRALVTQFNTAAPVPEPATMAILGVGAMALVRKRRSVQK